MSYTDAKVGCDQFYFPPISTQSCMNERSPDNIVWQRQTG